MTVLTSVISATAEVVERRDRRHDADRLVDGEPELVQAGTAGADVVYAGHGHGVYDRAVERGGHVLGAAACGGPPCAADQHLHLPAPACQRVVGLMNSTLHEPIRQVNRL
jgi:hypothetical protein